MDWFTLLSDTDLQLTMNRPRLLALWLAVHCFCSPVNLSKAQYYSTSSSSSVRVKYIIRLTRFEVDSDV